MQQRMGACVLSTIAMLTLGFAVTPLMAAEVVVEKGITYGKGGDKDLKLDLARPEQSTGLLPAIVYIHGGGWQGGSREMYQNDIKDAAKRGYVAVAISYRLTDPDASHKAKHPFPAQVEDVKCAVRWLRANAEKYHVDPNRIGATGGSAGGHLSLMLGVLGESNKFEGTGGHPGVSSRVQAVVNYFGPTDLIQLAASSKRVAEILDVLLDGPPEKEGASYRAASPITYVSKNDPPILTVHGTADPVVPVEQATEFDAAMKKAGASHQLLLLEGEGHGFKKEAAKKAREATFKFFDEHLKNKG